MEGKPKLTLLEGDEDRLIVVNEEIKRLEKVKAFMSSDGWKIMLATIETEKRKIVESITSDPTKLEYKAGILYGLKLVQDYVDNSDRMLSFLYGQRSELIELAARNKEEEWENG